MGEEVAMGNQVNIFPTQSALFDAAAQRVADLAQQSIQRQDRFTLALAGGSTPSHLYRRLADAPLAHRVDWSKVHVFFGDERCVPPDHPDSNYRMARESLLDHVPIPAPQVHRMEGERSPAEAARDYARVLKEQLAATNKGVPQLDLVLLGLGPDGHVASLFPDTDALNRRSPAVANYVPKLSAWRISLSFPVINRARNILLLVSGEKKADVVRHVLRPQSGAVPLPVQRIVSDAQLEWFLDAGAARHLKRRTHE